MGVSRQQFEKLSIPAISVFKPLSAVYFYFVIASFYVAFGIHVYIKHCILS